MGMIEDLLAVALTSDTEIDLKVIGIVLLITIPFAFAAAALISGRLGNQWLNDTHKWTIFAWVTLGVGNIIGMWWAYVELGWGGYWAWDPVENAGLMPWLLGTAFLHMTMMQRKRDMFKVFSMLLIFTTYAMCIFGTYLTRSNLLSSVHKGTRHNWAEAKR